MLTGNVGIERGPLRLRVGRRRPAWSSPTGRRSGLFSTTPRIGAARTAAGLRGSCGWGWWCSCCLRWELVFVAVSSAGARAAETSYHWLMSNRDIGVDCVLLAHRHRHPAWSLLMQSQPHLAPHHHNRTRSLTRHVAGSWLRSWSRSRSHPRVPHGGPSDARARAAGARIHRRCRQGHWR